MVYLRRHVACATVKSESQWLKRWRMHLDDMKFVAKAALGSVSQELSQER
jgi:hypothetical protein